ncbi:MAG: WD40 repeat domain-containing protein, partial [Cyanobacteria bacterium J06643_4]
SVGCSTTTHTAQRTVGCSADWEEAIDVAQFLGRHRDLDTLQSWVVRDRCRMIGIFGIGGIGKTTLSVKLAQQLQNRYDFVIWRSLCNAPLPQTLLTGLLKRLSHYQETQQSLPDAAETLISALIPYLQNNRCLLVLDNAETILQSGKYCGQFRAGYEAYGTLFERIGNLSHQSCLLLTSREIPSIFSTLSGVSLPVRSYCLPGLTTQEGQQLLQKKETFSGSAQQWETLVQLYRGNPLALQIAGATIVDVFNGNLTDFLAQKIIVFDDIIALLKEQFERLCVVEKEIMYWLAIEREPITLSDLQTDILTPLPARSFLESIQSLLRRSLVIKTAHGFTQQPVVMEYICDRFNQKICEEIITQRPALLSSHALTKAQTKDYIRQAQKTVILHRIKQQLKTNPQLATNLQDLIAIAHQTPQAATSYLAGNIIHLKQLFNLSLEGDNFSGLTIRQANLHNTQLQHVRFNHSTFVASAFTQTVGVVYAIAISPNGQYIAAGTDSNEIILWDLISKQQYRRLTGHRNHVFSVAFSPDSRRLASGSFDHSLKLWDLDTGQLVSSHVDQQAQIIDLAFSPNGQLLAASSGDYNIVLRDAQSGRALQTLQGHTQCVSSIAFSPNGQYLVSSCLDGTVKRWHITTGQCLQSHQVHQSMIWSITFHPNGQSCFTASSDHTSKQIDPQTGECLQVFKGHTRQLGSVACTADGHTLITSGHDHTIRCWDIPTGTCKNVLEGHRNAIWAAALSPDEQTIASGGMDRTVKLWDAHSGKQLYSLQGYVGGIWATLFLDNNRIISGDEDGTIRIWDIEHQTLKHSWQTHQGILPCLAAHPREPYIVSGGADGTVKLWHTETKQLIHTFGSHDGWIMCADISADGRYLATGCRDWALKIWDLKTNTCLQTIGEDNKALLWSLKFSTDGKMVATASYDAQVRLWDIASGQCIHALQGHTHFIINTVDITKDSRYVVSGGHDRTVRVWETQTGHCTQVLKGHESEIWAVAISPNGQLIASVGYDPAIRIWDIKTGKCLHVLEGHHGWKRTVQFSPDGQRLVSGGYDQSLHLWDIHSGQQLSHFQPLKPYEKMDITHVRGLNQEEQETLLSLGAVQQGHAMSGKGVKK